jgi:hypothetical protein
MLVYEPVKRRQAERLKRRIRGPQCRIRPRIKKIEDENDHEDDWGIGSSPTPASAADPPNFYLVLRSFSNIKPSGVRHLLAAPMAIGFVCMQSISPADFSCHEIKQSSFANQEDARPADRELKFASRPEKQSIALPK